jgi:DNA-binding Lrp family transcriptional regulator
LTKRIKKNNDKKILPPKSIRNEQSQPINSENPLVIFDKINIEIMKYIWKNPDIKSSEIAEKVDIPLSTIQRRRSRIENSSLLRKSFDLHYHRLGMRTADLLIKITKGDVERIVDQIIEKHSKSVLEVTVRIGHPDVNLVVKIVYKDNDEIYEIMRTVNTIENLESIQWSEILKDITVDRDGLIENLLSRVRSI